MKGKDIKIELYGMIQKDLPKDLTYHGIHHTIDVHNVCKFYIDHYDIKGKDAELLELAAVAHDMGFIETYKNHEIKGSEMVSVIMKKYKYSKADIDLVVELILATQIPQAPKSFLAKIICDADLDYLGRNDFESIGATLKKEWINYNIFPNLDEDFDKIQIGFLQGHQYHTDYAQDHRNPVKLDHLEHLRLKLQHD